MGKDRGGGGGGGGEGITFKKTNLFGYFKKKNP